VKIECWSCPYKGSVSRHFDCPNCGGFCWTDSTTPDQPPITSLWDDPYITLAFPLDRVPRTQEKLLTRFHAVRSDSSSRAYFRIEKDLIRFWWEWIKRDFK